MSDVYTKEVRGCAYAIAAAVAAVVAAAAVDDSL
jgi:hypothetical protein